MRINVLDGPFPTFVCSFRRPPVLSPSLAHYLHGACLYRRRSTDWAHRSVDPHPYLCLSVPIDLRITIICNQHCEACPAPQHCMPATLHLMYFCCTTYTSAQLQCPSMECRVVNTVVQSSIDRDGGASCGPNGSLNFCLLSKSNKYTRAME